MRLMQSFGSIGVVLAVASNAHAWDRVVQPAGGLPDDFTPSVLAKPDANGFWAFGYDAAPVLVRYSNDGTVQHVRYPQNRFDDSYAALASGADGGVVLGWIDGFQQPHCVLRRYDANATLRWTNEVAGSEAGATGQGCGDFQLDGAGGVWLRGAKVVRLASDGALDVAVSYADVDAMNGILADPASSNVYLFGSVGTNGATRALIEKISRQGALVWRWQAPAADGNSAIAHLLVGGDGNLYAFGSSSVGSAAATVYAARLSTAGQSAWTRVLNQSASGSGDVAALPVGGAYVLSGDTLLRIDAQGRIAWSQATNASADCHAGRLRSSPSGDAIVAEDCAVDANGNSFALARFDGSGGTRFATHFSGSYYGDLAVLQDGTSLVVTEHNATDTGHGIIFHPPTFTHSSADGGTLAPPQTAGVVTADDVLAASAFGGDGSTYLLAAGAGGHSLSRVGPDGSLLWRVHGDGEWGIYNVVKLVVAGDAVCAVGIRDPHETFECRASADGALRGSATFGDGLSTQDAGNVTYARGLDNGQVVVLFSYDLFGNSVAEHVLLRNDGGVVHDVAALQPKEAFGGASINARGQSLILTGWYSFALIETDGTRAFSGTLDAALGHVLQAFLTDDGAALILSQSAHDVLLTRVNASGAPLWTHTLLSSATQLMTDHLASAQAHGDDFYLALGTAGLVFVGDDTLHRSQFLLQRISLADGSAPWSDTLSEVLFSYPQLRIDQSGEHLLALSGWPTRLHTRLIDTQNGGTLAERFEDCANEFCALVGASVTPDGTLRIAADTSGDSSGNRHAAFERLRAFDTPAAIGVAQNGVAGAWYALYEGGQGFTIDYIGAAQTLFMPWFTYAVDGANAPDGLAWYALQGVVGTGSTASDLTITMPQPGAFANGTVASRAVGSAHLSFADCDTATLAYQFDADVNDGASGTISLARLTPSSDACTLADGSVVAAQVQAAPAQGFDARQSGSWFDPATSGQGLEITVLPPGSGSNGLLFAAWFTFDPAGRPDDPAQQHWFTLQGDLAGATNGTVSLPILRTIGGSFDARPTANTVQVGTATLKFTTCDAAELAYAFDSSDVAHAFAGLSGTLRLARIGGCAAP